LQTIRVWFSKQGEACYISHLDLQRVVQRALKCAGAPVWYTQGFNPHIYLTFALPLPLGQQSLAESFDFKTERQIIDTEAIYWDLNRALPRGIRVYDVTGAKMGPGEIAWARYLVRFAGDPLQTRQKVDAFLAQKEILVEKRTKRGGMKQVDLAPHIAKKEWLPLAGEACLDLILPAGSTLNLNPDLLLGALEAKMDAGPLEATVCRTQVLTASFEKFE